MSTAQALQSFADWVASIQFDQIWVYDFNQVVDEPLVQLEVAELASQAADKRLQAWALQHEARQ